MEWLEENKYSHEDVGYEDSAKGVDHCSSCDHYLPWIVPACEIVKKPIAPRAWCRKFQDGTTDAL